MLALDLHEIAGHFISVAILVGNLWGIWRGECPSANPRARSQLNRGLVLVLVAVTLIAFGCAVR
jgi:hypothetical protein